MGLFDAAVRKLRGLPDVGAMEEAGEIDALIAAAGHVHEGTQTAAFAAISRLWERNAEHVRNRLLAAIVLPKPGRMSLGNPDAAIALGRVRDKAAVQPLIAMLTSAEPDVRTEAVRALGLIGDLGAQSYIVAELRRDEGESNHWTRVAAANALGMMRSPSPDVLDALLVAAVSEYRYLREAAQNALKATGRADLAEQAFKTFTDAETLRLVKAATRMGLEQATGRKPSGS
jgi:HEAT repeat protein